MKRSALVAALILAACSVERPPPVIGIDDAWARTTLPGQSSTAVYLTIENLGGGDRLLSVSSPIGHAAVHSTSTHGGVMRMRPVESIDIPADSTVEFAPGGTHLMLTGLEAPLAAGAAVPIELEFERTGKMRATAAVRAAAAGGVEM